MNTLYSRIGEIYLPIFSQPMNPAVNLPVKSEPVIDIEAEVMAVIDDDTYADLAQHIIDCVEYRRCPVVCFRNEYFDNDKFTFTLDGSADVYEVECRELWGMERVIKSLDISCLTVTATGFTDFDMDALQLHINDKIN